MAAIPGRSLVERALRRDRMMVTAALLGVVALCWIYLLAGAGMPMHDMGGMLMATSPQVWTPGYVALVFVMWSVMMAAMMLPGAAPMVLLYRTVARVRVARGERAPGWTVFAGGYLAVWAAFSVLAVALQIGLDRASLLSPMMQTTSRIVAGTVLVLAGLYQWTPLKQQCLSRCRSPLEFLLAHWRPGRRGAFRMGAEHGLYCVGCCWAVMLLLFAGGVMNVLWIAGLSLFVLVEKLAPGGPWIGRGIGVLLVAWGIATWVAVV